jgi:hypothetical protein
LTSSVTTQDTLDISYARQVLDEDHYDLDKIKERILEYLSVRKLRLERAEEREEEELPTQDFIRRERNYPPKTSSAANGKASSSASWVHRAWARHRWDNPLPGLWIVSSLV